MHLCELFSLGDAIVVGFDSGRVDAPYRPATGAAGVVVPGREAKRRDAGVVGGARGGGRAAAWEPGPGRRARRRDERGLMRANSMLSDESDGRNLRSEPSSRQKSVQLMREGGLSSVRVRVRRIHRAPRGIFPAVVHPRVTPRSRRRPLAFRVLLTARGRKCTRRVQLAPRGIEPREPDRATRREAQLMLPSSPEIFARPRPKSGRDRCPAPGRVRHTRRVGRNSHPFPSRHPRRNNNRSTTLVFSPARSPYRRPRTNPPHERVTYLNAIPDARDTHHRDRLPIADRVDREVSGRVDGG